MYNRARPHQALGMKTPYEMMTGSSDNPLLRYELPRQEVTKTANQNKSYNNLNINGNETETDYRNQKHP